MKVQGPYIKRLKILNNRTYLYFPTFQRCALQRQGSRIHVISLRKSGRGLALISVLLGCKVEVFDIVETGKDYDTKDIVWEF